jgi:hypothetical protein
MLLLSASCAALNAATTAIDLQLKVGACPRARSLSYVRVLCVFVFARTRVAVVPRVELDANRFFVYLQSNPSTLEASVFVGSFIVLVLFGLTAMLLVIAFGWSLYTSAQNGALTRIQLQRSLAATVVAKEDTGSLAPVRSQDASAQAAEYSPASPGAHAPDAAHSSPRSLSDNPMISEGSPSSRQVNAT